MKIKNNNEQSINLCYTYNFIEKDYIYNPKTENCFDLKEKNEKVLTIFNPWNKYLDNRNNLFDKSDSYYLIVYSENDNLIKNLEFSSNEEILEIHLKINENKIATLSHSQNVLIKSSNKENQIILIHFSPIVDIKNIISANNDEYSLISQFAAKALSPIDPN